MLALKRFYDVQLAEVIGRMRLELDRRYTYHTVEHTLDVIKCCEEISFAEGLNESENLILQISALFHDTGFLLSRKNHEERSVDIFTEARAEFQLEPSHIREIENCIRATRVPQEPQSRLEQIICDADLDYLGRIDFWTISDSLFVEMTNCKEISGSEAWKELQIRFMTAHRFHTKFSKNRRDEQLIINLGEVKAKN
jgi:predicted metal-dependent HD superfamily phosphohydrolase